MTSQSATKRDLPTCCLPMEVKARDLDARLYLAIMLNRVGCNCIIGEKGAVNAVTKKLTSPIYFLKGAMAGAAKQIQEIYDSGARIVYLDEEGGVFDSSADHLSWRTDDQILQYVDLYFAWGQNQQSHVQKRTTALSSDKIIVTGHPRFDLANPAFDEVFTALNRSSEIPENSSPKILINTSFPYGNDPSLPVGGTEKFTELIEAIRGKNFSESDFKRKFHYQSLLYQEFLVLIEKLATTFPQAQVIVRPHPAERQASYQERFSGFPNIHVSKEGGLRSWLVQCHLVIHHDCTTAIEAVINQKPVLSYCPVLSLPLAQRMPVQLGSRAESFIEVKDFVEQHLALPHRVMDKALEPTVQPWIANCLQPFSAKEISRIIEENYLTGACPKPHSKRNIALAENELLNLSADQLQLQQLRSIEKFPGLTAEEVRTRITAFRALDASLPSITVSEREGAFELSPCS